MELVEARKLLDIRVRIGRDHQHSSTQHPRASLSPQFLSMDDLYDEFGNFIGDAEEESEEESQHGVEAGGYAYDDFTEEQEPTAETGQELMEIDGKLV